MDSVARPSSFSPPVGPTGPLAARASRVETPGCSGGARSDVRATGGLRGRTHAGPAGAGRGGPASAPDRAAPGHLVAGAPRSAVRAAASPRWSFLGGDQPPKYRLPDRLYRFGQEEQLPAETPPAAVSPPPPPPPAPPLDPAVAAETFFAASGLAATTPQTFVLQPRPPPIVPAPPPIPEPPAPGWFSEPILARAPVAPHPSLINDDFAVTLESQRTFGTADFFSLWIGLVVCVPTYYLAGSLVELGFAWWQGVLTVFVSNLIVLVPMILAAHPGTKYGVPFSVLIRASWGPAGARVPSVLRAVVGCFWFGIQTWIGGEAIYQLLNAALGGALAGSPIPLLGICCGELLCFAAFWAAQVAIIVRGVECIKQVEAYAAPVLIGLSLALLAWALQAAGGFGPILAAPPRLGLVPPMSALLPAITANVGFWATLSLNISDFSRYARSQRAQVVGQALGLPVFMGAFSFLGIAVTSATAVIFGATVSDPLQLLARLEGTGPRVAALAGLILATLTTNIAANVVAPANAFVSLDPRRFTFTAGGLLTASLGAAIMPWRLVASSAGFMDFLIGYSALLGPIGGILCADYFVLRQRRLDIDGLYSADATGPYWYVNGYNPAALLAFALGVLPCLPGFLKQIGLLKAIPPLLATIYDGAWFAGFAVGGAVYLAAMARRLADRGGSEEPAPAGSGPLQLHGMSAGISPQSLALLLLSLAQQLASAVRAVTGPRALPLGAAAARAEQSAPAAPQLLRWSRRGVCVVDVQLQALACEGLGGDLADEVSALAIGDTRDRDAKMRLNFI